MSILAQGAIVLRKTANRCGTNIRTSVPDSITKHGVVFSLVNTVVAFGLRSGSYSRPTPAGDKRKRPTILTDVQALGLNGVVG